MIRLATGLAERVEAADFVFRLARPDLPVRIMAHAVSPEYQGRGWGPEMIRHVLSQHAVVGGAGNVDRQDRRDYGSRLGFTHWYGTPDPNVMVGFNQPVELPRGLLFAVPIAGRRDIASAEARLRMSSRSQDRHDYARRMAGL